jgi:hypothetical protein
MFFDTDYEIVHQVITFDEADDEEFCEVVFFKLSANDDDKRTTYIMNIHDSGEWVYPEMFTSLAPTIQYTFIYRNGDDAPKIANLVKNLGLTNNYSVRVWV